jgi:predicted RNA-binding protein YlqC (UPF0109 family)
MLTPKLKQGRILAYRDSHAYLGKIAMKELIEYIAKSLVDDPSQVKVTEVITGYSMTLELEVAPEDMGRVIGKNGRVANAMRVLVRVPAAKQGKRVTLEII